MKFFTPLILLLAGILAGGCAYTGPGRTSPAEPKANAVAPAIVTPDNSLKAKVASYNSAGRFVVLSVAAGPMPGLDQTLFLYRGGLKVAELKVTGPQNENNIVADLVTGDAQTGDDVRDQ
jgi:hypothetical protein